jgi:hypothetical protein
MVGGGPYGKAKARLVRNSCEGFETAAPKTYNGPVTSPKRILNSAKIISWRIGRQIKSPSHEYVKCPNPGRIDPALAWRNRGFALESFVFSLSPGDSTAQRQERRSGLSKKNKPCPRGGDLKGWRIGRSVPHLRPRYASTPGFPPRDARRRPRMHRNERLSPNWPQRAPTAEGVDPVRQSQHGPPHGGGPQWGRIDERTASPMGASIRSTLPGP